LHLRRVFLRCILQLETMTSRARVGFSRLLVCGWLVCGAPMVFSADSAAPGTNDGLELAPSPYWSRAEQQEFLQQTIEQTRREAETSARRNADALIQRLNLFQQSLETQHQRELAAVQNSNRTALMVAGVLAGAGFLGMFCLAFFLMRATNRLTDVALAVPLGPALVSGHVSHALTSGVSLPAAGNPADLAGARFLGAIERLEKRLHGLEQTTQQNPPADSSALSNGEPKFEDAVPPTTDIAEEGKFVGGSAEGTSFPKAAAGDFMVGEPVQNNRRASREFLPDTGPASQLVLLLAKGQTLLSLDKAEEALACFDQVVALEPRHAEALVKKGTALERLRRTDEALECYDRAIAMDGMLTTAYLRKGGVFNRLERYDEALKCYEQALQIGQKSAAS